MQRVSTTLAVRLMYDWTVRYVWAGGLRIASMPHRGAVSFGLLEHLDDILV